jgi:hypothetical protein
VVNDRERSEEVTSILKDLDTVNLEPTTIGFPWDLKKNMGLKMAHEPKMMAMSHAFPSRFVLVVVLLVFVVVGVGVSVVVSVVVVVCCFCCCCCSCSCSCCFCCFCCFCCSFVVAVVYLTCLIDYIMLYPHPDVFPFFLLVASPTLLLQFRSLVCEMFSP